MTTDEDGFEKYLKSMEDLAKTVMVKDGCIVINVHYEYSIQISRCNTHEKILGWVYHLTEKTWMSRDILRYFVQVSCRESGLNIPYS
jgi:hypothetical protein